MTELSPDVEVVLSSDLFNDDPCLESMSAPALAVLNAYMTGWGWLDSPTKKDCRGVAAALRAAACQLREAYANETCVEPADDWLDSVATELENSND